MNDRIIAWPVALLLRLIYPGHLSLEVESDFMLLNSTTVIMTLTQGYGMAFGSDDGPRPMPRKQKAEVTVSHFPPHLRGNIHTSLFKLVCVSRLFFFKAKSSVNIPQIGSSSNTDLIFLLKQLPIWWLQFCYAYWREAMLSSHTLSNHIHSYSEVT